MIKKLFLLAISSILLFSTCKKDKVEEESGPPKFTFTFNRIFDENPDKSTPPGFLFLYDSNGQIVKEQEIFDNRTIELTTTKEGTYSVGVFMRQLYGGNSFSYTVYQNIPSGITNITPVTDNSNSFIRSLKIKNISALDSIYNGVYKSNYNFKKDTKNKTVLLDEFWSLLRILKVYANGDKSPKYLIFNEKDKLTPNSDTLVYDYVQMPKVKNQILKFPYTANWGIDIYTKLGSNTRIIGSNIDYYHWASVSEQNILVKIPELSYEKYYCKLNANRYFGDSYYQVKNDLSEPFELPLFYFDYEKQPNGTILCKDKNGAKVVESYGAYQKDANTPALAYLTVYSPTNILPFTPQLPQTVINRYNLKGLTLSIGQGGSIIGTADEKISFEEAIKYCAGSFDSFWPYERGVYSKSVR